MWNGISREIRIFLSTVQRAVAPKGSNRPCRWAKSARCSKHGRATYSRCAVAIQAISRKYGEINVMTRKTRHFSTNCDNAMGRGGRGCDSRERTAPPKSSLHQEAAMIQRFLHLIKKVIFFSFSMKKKTIRIRK